MHKRINYKKYNGQNLNNNSNKTVNSGKNKNGNKSI